MLADEVTHVKMGSDWLRRLTDKDPERRERALEFQRTVDTIFNLGGFRGEDDENPIQLARRFRELAGFTDEENDSLAALARESTEQAREMAEMATADARRVGAGAALSREPQVTVTPGPVHADRLRRGRDRGASSRMSRRWSGFPADVEIADRRRRGAVRAARRAHVRRRRRPMRRSGSRVATSRTTAGPARSRPSRPAATSTIMLLRGQGPALRRLRRRAARRRAHAGRARRVGHLRGRPRRAARAAGAAPARSSTTSGSSTASPTSPTPRSSGSGTTPTTHVGGDPGDLRGDRRRRPRPSRRSPSTSSARSSSSAVGQLTRPGSQSQVVGGDGVVEVDRRAWPASSGERRVRHVGHERGVEVAPGPPRPTPTSRSRGIGHACVADATRSTLRHPVDAAGQHDVVREHRGERSPRRPATASKVAVSTATSTSSGIMHLIDPFAPPRGHRVDHECHRPLRWRENGRLTRSVSY